VHAIIIFIYNVSLLAIVKGILLGPRV
jgi:hypothetical protein